MKYRLAGVRKVISGTLSDIELYSCCFNPAKRRHTLAQASQTSYEYENLLYIPF